MEKNKRKEETIICVLCPLACEIKIIIDDWGNVQKMVGAKCDKGKEYALKEHTRPERVLTTTVRTSKVSHPLLSVRTDRPVPKNLLEQCMGLLAKVKINSSVKKGGIILHNILKTGANVIATQELSKNED